LATNPSKFARLRFVAHPILTGGRMDGRTK
jgi:hypothetical protein